MRSPYRASSGRSAASGPGGASRFLFVLLAGAALAAFAGSQAVSAPPAPEIPLTWELEFRLLDPPTPILYTPAGSRSPQRYWYIRYSVANLTGEDQYFIPDFVLYTDTGELIQANVGVPSRVFEQIKLRHNDPFLLSSSNISGRILQGRDNARHGVAIFPEIDPRAGVFDVFVGGLSGDTTRVELPTPIEVQRITPLGEVVTEQASQVKLTKTLHLRYRLPGEAGSRLRAEPKLLKRGWIMR